MDRDELQRSVVDVVRNAEVRAVAQALSSGGRPVLGQFIDYAIEPMPAIASKQMKPYRLVIEQWHLDAAEEMLRAARPNRLGHAAGSTSKFNT